MMHLYHLYRYSQSAHQHEICIHLTVYNIRGRFMSPCAIYLFTVGYIHSFILSFPFSPSSGLLRLVLLPKMCNVLKTASPLQAPRLSALTCSR